MSRLRHQLPAYSPVSLRAIIQAARAAAPVGADPRRRVIELLRRQYEAEQVTLCGSGTHALQLAVRQAWQVLGEKTTVALPAFSCFDIGSAAVGVDARIALYDLDPGTLSPDWDSFRSALASGARVAIVAPLYGIPVDWDAGERCAEGYGAVLIEDAAQGAGAFWRGRPLGALGRLSVLSFGRGKGWSAVRGGTLMTRALDEHEDAELELLQAGPTSELSVVVSAAAQWTLGRPSLYGLPVSIPGLGLGETRYKDPTAPQRLSRAGARLLECTRHAADQEAELRRQRAKGWKETIRFGPHARPIEVPDHGTAGFLRFPLRLSRGVAGIERPRSALRLGAAPSYPRPLGALPPVAARLHEPHGRWPGAEELVRTLVTLPTHSMLTMWERSRLLRLLSDYPH
ncbi:MAG: DegT/DnrJ/EryC1/StrS family aminotransferase [Gemmatimonadota bacterium]|nr:DegT/DnrJ/EryC1/StrS family aminotransferase [Gemmatimonadota bacterium]